MLLNFVGILLIKKPFRLQFRKAYFVESGFFQIWGSLLPLCKTWNTSVTQLSKHTLRMFLIMHISCVLLNDI